jgi:hypothetical protein
MKLFKLLLIGMFLMGTTSIAMASTIGFNPDGSGAVTIDKLSGQVVSNYNVTTQLGTDGVLDSGDTFTEAFTLGISFGDLGGVHKAFYSYVNGNPVLYAVATGITGNITDFSGPTDTTNGATAANPNNILNDSFKIQITGGTISLYYDSTGAMSSASPLGTFDVPSGISTDYTPGGNSTLTATVGLNLLSTSLASGVWFTPNASGTDVTTTANPFLIGLGDSSNNLIAFTGDDNGTPNNLTDDSLTATVQDNGTTAQFSAVPEPTTLVLLGLGLIGMAALGRKKVTLSCVFF